MEEAVKTIPDNLTTGAQVQAAVIPILADLIDPDRALRELASLAYADPRQLFDEVGNLRPIHSLPPEIAAMVGQFEVIKKNATAGDGHTDTVAKIKVWDKPKTLHMLLTHLGLLTERVSLDGGLKITHEVL